MELLFIVIFMHLELNSNNCSLSSIVFQSYTKNQKSEKVSLIPYYDKEKNSCDFLLIFAFASC